MKWLCAVACCAFCAWATPLVAQDAVVAQAKASFKAGAAAYEMGDYLAAIQALEAAYGLTPLPAIAFSLAQAERRQYLIGRDPGHLTRAIELYRRYLREVGSGGRRADALEALGQLEPLAVASRGEASPPPVKSAEPVTPAPEVAQTRLMVSCDAPGAQISLDGASKVAAPLIAQVAPGTHKLEVEAPGFFPYTREVEAIAGALVPIDVALREQPATLDVSADPEASLQLDGSFVANVGRRRKLSLASGAHVLTFTRGGHRSQSVDLRLAPGQTTEYSAQLAPTAQRTASLVLFGVGAASLLGGAVFGALALDHEGDAKALLERRMHENLSVFDRDEYADRRSDRDRLRVVAVASFIGAAACLLTGLVLYLVDPPEAPPERTGG